MDVMLEALEEPEGVLEQIQLRVLGYLVGLDVGALGEGSLMSPVFTYGEQRTNIYYRLFDDLQKTGLF